MAYFDTSLYIILRAIQGHHSSRAKWHTGRLTGRPKYGHLSLVFSIPGLGFAEIFLVEQSWMSHVVPWCPMMSHAFFDQDEKMSPASWCVLKKINIWQYLSSFRKPGSDFESPVAFWAVLYELGLPWERVLGHGPNRNASKTDSFYKSNIWIEVGATDVEGLELRDSSPTICAS